MVMDRHTGTHHGTHQGDHALEKCLCYVNLFDTMQGHMKPVCLGHYFFLGKGVKRDEGWGEGRWGKG